MTAQPAPSLLAERRRVITAGICALILTVGMGRFAYTPMLPIMNEQAGLSILAGGWLATLNYAGYMSGVLLAATVCDLQQKYRLYRHGLLLALVSTVGMGLTDNVYLWALLRYLAGFSNIAGLLLASGLVLNWLIRHGFKPELGLHFMGMGLGLVITGVAVASMVDQLSWQGQWFWLTVLGLLFFVPAWWWMPAPASMPAAPAGTTAATNASPGGRWMRLMTGAYFCAGFGYVVTATFIVAILAELPLLAGKGNWIWVIAGVAAAPSCFLWDRIAAATGQVQALLLAYALQTVSIILPVLTGSATLNVIGAILYGITFVGIVSLTLTLTGRHFPANPAKAMARMTLSYGVAQIVAPAMAGYIANATGSYHGALIVTALVMVLGMGLLLALLQEEKRHAVRGTMHVVP